MITPLAPGIRLKNRYQIIKLIGRGGQCIVYLTYDQFSGKSVVVKCHIDQSTDYQERTQNLQLFLKEHLFLSKLFHPSLPRAYEHFEEQNKHYLVVDFVPGQNLEQVLKSRPGPISEKEAIDWGIQIAKTLNYLSHQKPNPVVIRDIKPSNIQYTPDRRIMLIDFSIAREWKANKKDTVRMGSPGYAAPEQYRGNSDIRSDIYSLGVTLYEALTKKDPTLTPFKYPPVRQINPRVSIEMEKILLKAMNTDITRRYQHPKEMLDELKELDALGNLSTSDKAKKYFQMGEKELQSNNYKKALEYYSQSVKYESSVGDYRARLGEVNYKLGNLEIALKEIYQATISGFMGLLKPEEVNKIRKQYEEIKKELLKSWPVFSKNLSRTGCQSFETELMAPLAVLWQKEMFDIPPKSSPAIGPGMLFIGTKTGRMLGIDIVSGTIKWTFPTSNAIISSPAYHNGTVYFGANDANVYALDALTGTKKWIYKTKGAVFSSPAVYKGFVYIGSSDNKLYALNAINGVKAWEFDSKSSIISSPAIADEKVFFGNMSGSLFAISASTGQTCWIFDAGGPISASPSVENNLVYTGCFDGKIYAVDTAGGKLKWVYKTHRKTETNVSVSQGIVFAASSDTNIYGLDAFNGGKIWHFRADSPILASPISANKTVYVLTNYLYCLSDRTGKLIWEMNVPGPSHSTPAIANSTLYFTSGKSLFSCGCVSKISEKHYEEGNKLFKAGQHMKAAGFYKQALSMIRKKEYMEGLARAYYLSNDDTVIDETIKLIKELIIIKYSIEYSLWLGDLFFKKRDYDEALDNYEKALQIDNNLDWPRFRAGLINYKFKANPQKAIEMIEEAIKLKPSNPVYLKTLGEVYENNGQVEEAIKTYTRAMAVNPGDNEVKGKLKSLKEGIEAIKDFENGKKLMAKGFLDAAINSFEKAVENRSKSDYHFELAKAYLAKKDKRFMAQFDKAYGMKPLDREYLLAGGVGSLEQLLKEGEKDKEQLKWTLDTLKKLLSVTKLKEHHTMVGECLYLSGNYEEALTEYMNGTELTEEVEYKISRCYINTNKPEEAIKTLSGLIEKYPDKLTYYKDLGFLLLGLKREKEAIKILNKALEIAPEDEEIKEKFSEIKRKHEEAEKAYSEGLEKLQMYQLEEALNLFNRAIEILPDEIKFHHKLAETYLYNKNFDRAEVVVDKVIRLSPKNSSYLALKGEILTSKKDYKGGVKAYEKAIELNPAEVAYYIKIGEIFERTENLEEALEKFKKASAIAPSNENIKERIKILESYQGVKRWPMIGRVPERTAFQEKEKELAPPSVLRWSFLKENWVFETKGKIRSSPVVDNGLVYTGSCDKQFYALDIYSGEKKWQNSTGGEILASPLVHKNCVYIGSQDSIFYAFDAVSGRFLWMYNPGSPLAGSPIAIKDMIYIVTDKGGLHCLHRANGQIIWKKELGGPVHASISAEKNIIYISTLNGKILAIRAEDGEIFWERSLASKVTASVVISNSALFIGSWDKNFYAMRKDNGEVMWTFKCGGRITASSATDGESVFFGSEDKKIYALNSSTGELIWDYQTRGKIEVSPAIGNNLIYTGSDDGKIYSIETRTGRPWEYKTGGPVRTSPAIAESMLFIGSDDKKLYCFRNYKPDETPLPASQEEEKSWWRKIF